MTPSCRRAIFYVFVKAEISCQTQSLASLPVLLQVGAKVNKRRCGRVRQVGCLLPTQLSHQSRFPPQEWMRHNFGKSGQKRQYTGREIFPPHPPPHPSTTTNPARTAKTRGNFSTLKWIRRDGKVVDLLMTETIFL